MAIFQGDLVIKNIISLSIEDMRKNPWLIDDMFSSLINNPYLKAYGQKEIDNCKEWFLKNDIFVGLQYRVDKDKMPCVIVSLGNSSEKPEMKTLGDLSTEVDTLYPKQTGKPIPYIVSPFTPVSYTSSTKTMELPDSVDMTLISPGMILVNPDTKVGYVISEIVPSGIVISTDTTPSGSNFAIVPQFPYYRARRERTFFQETYQVGCHVSGDPAPLIWLHSIVLYGILRYREVLLEGQCFSESLVSSTDMRPTDTFGGPSGDIVYSRYISITGQQETSWLKTPYRVIESLTVKDDDGISSGIKIMSNIEGNGGIDDIDQIWTTVEE